MIIFHRLLLCLCFAYITSFQVFAEAPVVDDSENFAILDEQEAAITQPLAKEMPMETPNEMPLAQDTENDKANAGLLDKLQGMQQEIQELRGQLEVQAHDLKLLQQQQLSFYKDLDARLRQENTSALAQKNPIGQQEEISNVSPHLSKNESKQGNLPSNEKVHYTPKTSAARGNPAEEQISYLAAYDLVKNKRFDEALTAMKTFVMHYPQGGYTANAQYWLGELYMVKNAYAKAITHFDIVLKQFPSSSKAAASTLKIGYALAASGQITEAKERLQQVIQSYPDTPTAQLAAMKLQSLGIS